MTKLFEQNCLLDDFVDIIYLLTISVKTLDDIHRDDVDVQ